MEKYIPKHNNAPILFKQEEKDSDFSEREILYKVLFDMKNDLNQLKKVTNNIINGTSPIIQKDEVIEEDSSNTNLIQKTISYQNEQVEQNKNNEDTILTLQDHEIKMIKESLLRHQGRRKDAADELGISERTLYRKIKEYKL